MDASRHGLERGAGILMPISALPGPYGIGTLGKSAYGSVIGRFFQLDQQALGTARTSRFLLLQVILTILISII